MTDWEKSERFFSVEGRGPRFQTSSLGFSREFHDKALEAARECGLFCLGKANVGAPVTARGGVGAEVLGAGDAPSPRSYERAYGRARRRAGDGAQGCGGGGAWVQRRAIPARSYERAYGGGLTSPA
jgi:hypothetical protein